ncbi:hypothetical protein, variant [Exophiala oligosperma]|uniref:Zn(2)-C6 fungal-type domain-containing protein n=1 Tax=Exophiala oligosperma TaxID=215243 RepID=A0A0D2EK06_9EURO|nr:hypothetical protein, variant [Exophiala oligosperma]KIW48239.1 hypothetical protein, variant [Exophiala oligosperma]
MPDPVSCQSCRTKKLKCNRVQPCSNCSARGISCHFLVPPWNNPDKNSNLTTLSNTPLLDRIEKLEAQLLQHELEARYSSGDYHLDKRQMFTPERGTPSSVHQLRDAELRLLENVATREDSVLHMLSNELSFRIRSVPDILKPTQVSGYDQRNERIITFPDYKTAAMLFQYHEAAGDLFVRILHIPTMRSLMKTLYLKLQQGDPIPIGQAALLLSILALAAFFYEPPDGPQPSTNTQDFLQLSKVFSKGALDILDYSRRNTSGTLEDVQAYIFMTVVTIHLDGFSARGRFLATSAATMARDLGLHRLDADWGSSSSKETSIRDLIDREVKRRVFWFITSTDWLWSTVSGPQEGTYFTHPNHINVKLPKDCDDDEVVLGESTSPTSETRPTGMTYMLERIRLAHLCRELADSVPLDSSKLEAMPYEQVINLDKKLVHFISTLPFFFRIDADCRHRAKTLETLYPNIPILRYCITRAAHSRRCKLHHRFLVRQSSDVRYAYSRQACLESARAVIQSHRYLAEDGMPWIKAARMGIAVHYVHLALVVLVMDLCFNRDQVDEQEIRAEVKATLQMFEDAKHVSPLLGRFLKSICGVTSKHKVYPQEECGTTSSSNETLRNPTYDGGNLNPLGDDGLLPTSQLDLSRADTDGTGLEFPPSFDEFWDSTMHQGGPDFDLSAWSNLFSSLDSQML